MNMKHFYLCVDRISGSGVAIVEGSEPYELSFFFDDGEISSITCNCFCSYHCKHEFAMLL